MHYGPIMIDLEGLELTSKECMLIQEPSVGGVLLFERNYTDKAQLKALVTSIRQQKPDPILIAVDHEGEPLWRFHKEFTKIPAAYFFGKLYQYHPEKALQAASQAGFVMAAELLSCGLDLSLAPVLDLEAPNSTCLKDRAFHPEPDVVATLAGAFIEGMHWAGMAAVGKHFPGHGGATQDPHVAVVHDPRSKDELMFRDMWPFQVLGPKLEAIMPAHVIYDQIEGVIPCRSRTWLQDILRGELGYEGAIISDSLTMEAAGGLSLLASTQQSIDAGCDMVIITGYNQKLKSLLSCLKWQQNSALRDARLGVLSGKADKEHKSQQPLEAAEIWEIL